MTRWVRLLGWTLALAAALILAGAIIDAAHKAVFK